MYHRQVGFARRFHFGKRIIVTPAFVPTLVLDGPGIGMVSPEFDDLDGGEQDTLDELARIERT